MLAQFFTPASSKAWVAGLVAAVLTPVIQLLSSKGEVTLRTLALAILSGVVSAVAVYMTTNTPPGPVPATETDTPGEHEAPGYGL